MSIYEEIDLDKVINCSGKMTALGVSKISDDVATAMKDAGQSFVVIDDLMDKAGEIVSEYTGAEDTCITSSASAGIAISVAGVITKGSLTAIEKMPLSDKNEIIIQKGHLINFGAPIETMIALGGGKVISVGATNKVKKAHLEESITENTAALFYVKSHHCVQKGMLSLEEMIEISKKHGLPIIVDAAAEGDLKKYISLGADMVIYSGAKAIEGPSSGFITGKKELIAYCKKQYLGIGRAMKIGKENIMGLVTAVKNYALRDEEKDVENQKRLIELLMKGLKELDLKVNSVQDEAGRPIYRVEIIHKNAVEIAKKLKSGPIKVILREHYANVGKLYIDVRSITEEDVPVIIKRFIEVLKSEES